MREYLLSIILVFITGTAAIAQVGVMEKFVQKNQKDSIELTRMEYDYSFSEGAKQKMLGNLDLAKDLYLKCTSLRPERPTAFYELASIYSAEGDVETARGFIEQAIILDPGNQWFKFLAINIAIEQGRFQDGAKYYHDLYTNIKDTREYRTGEIDMLSRAGDNKNALNKLDELEDLYGFSKYTAIRKKEIYLSMGKEKLAFKELEKLIKEYPGEVDIMGILAELYAEKGEEEKALKLFGEMKELNSGNPLVYFSLGKYYFDLGRKREAISEFKTGFSSKEVNPEIKIQVFLELIRTQGENEDLNNDMDDLLEVMYKTDKGNAGVDILYGDYLFNKEEYDEAEVIYMRVVESSPSNFLAWQNLLFIQNSQLDFEEMYTIADEAVKSFPNQPLFLLFKGMGASQTNRLETAIEALKNGLGINMNNAELTKQFYISLGDTYYQMDNYDEAFSNFESLLALDPDNTIVLNNYSYYLSVLDRDLEKALEMIEKCIAQENDNPTYLDTYAWVLFKLGKYEKSLDVINKVVKINPNPSGEVLEHYGDILFKNGEKVQAVEAWKKARESGEASDDIDSKIETGLK